MSYVAAIGAGASLLGGAMGGGEGGGSPAAPAGPVKFGAVAFKSSTATGNGKAKNISAGKNATDASAKTPVWLVPLIAIGAAVALLVTLLRKK